MRLWKTRLISLVANAKPLAQMSIKRGIYQGDSLSSLLLRRSEPSEPSNRSDRLQTDSDPRPVTCRGLTNQSLLHPVQVLEGLTQELEPMTPATNPGSTQSHTAVADASY